MYALIMAGGAGTRFWPKSRNENPKHLLSIINEKTMLENTIERLDYLMRRSNCYIITNKEQKENILKSVGGISIKNIIEEPFGKNTAAAVGYGALSIMLKDKDATMVVLPADHYIRNNKKFVSVIEKAVEVVEAKPESLVTIGIEPTYPETGYGYIQIGDNLQDNVYQVSSFAEKPNKQTALRFLENGDFYWNSGIFVWKAATILENIKIYLPDLYESLMEIKDIILNSNQESFDITKQYREIKATSIDYGVMEKADNVKAVVADFGWSDIGSWQEVYKMKNQDKDNNVVEANFLSLDTNGCYISSDDKEKLIATIGLENIAIINTKDALLVTPLHRSQDVKTIVEKIKAHDMKHLL